MPKNGFFFLFMAPVTPTAKKGRDGGRGRRRKTTDVRGSVTGRITARVTRAPEAELVVPRSPAHRGFPGRKFPKLDFRRLPAALDRG